MAPTESPAEDAHKIITEHNHTPQSGPHSAGWLWVVSGKGQGGLEVEGGERLFADWKTDCIRDPAYRTGSILQQQLFAPFGSGACVFEKFTNIWPVRRRVGAEWQCARELRTISLMKMCARVRAEACAKVVVVAVGLSRTRISRPVVSHIQGDQKIEMFYLYVWNLTWIHLRIFGCCNQNGTSMIN